MEPHSKASGILELAYELYPLLRTQREIEKVSWKDWKLFLYIGQGLPEGSVHPIVYRVFGYTETPGSRPTMPTDWSSVLIDMYDTAIATWTDDDLAKVKTKVNNSFGEKIFHEQRQ